MEKEEFIKLLSKKLSGDIAEEDLVRLTQLCNNNEAYSLLSAQFDRYFVEDKAEEPNISQLNKVWETIKRNDEQTFKEKFVYSAPKRFSLVPTNWLKVAAIVVGILGTGIFSYHLINRYTERNFYTLTTANGKTFKMLDDGTKVWLNKNSTLRYNKAFGAQKREISLRGEAYFDVVKNAAVPLFIHIGNIDIEVKGTAFNVNAYQDKQQIKVSLVSGLIEVTDRLDETQKVLLHPNEKLIFNATTGLKQQAFLVSTIERASLLNDTKWMADTLTFTKEKLVNLALRMERKYDLKISIQSELLKEKRFSGRFTNETINQALEALKLSYPLTYTINNRWVVIKD